MEQWEPLDEWSTPWRREMHKRLIRAGVDDPIPEKVIQRIKREAAAILEFDEHSIKAYGDSMSATLELPNVRPLDEAGRAAQARKLLDQVNGKSVSAGQLAELRKMQLGDAWTHGEHARVAFHDAANRPIYYTFGDPVNSWDAFTYGRRTGYIKRGLK